MEKLSQMPRPKDVLYRRHDFDGVKYLKGSKEYVDFTAVILSEQEHIDHMEKSILAAKSGGERTLYTREEIALVKLRQRAVERGESVGIAAYRIIECADDPSLIGVVDSCIFEFDTNGRGTLTYNKHWRK